MDRYPANDEGLELEADAVSDDTLRATTDSLPPVGRPRMRIMAAPSAIAGALLITTVALGAAGIRPEPFDTGDLAGDPGAAAVAVAGTDHDVATGDDAADEPRNAAGSGWKDEWWATDVPRPESNQEPKDAPKEQPKDAPKEQPKVEPKDDPAPAPKPKPSIQALGLTLAKGDGKVKVDWTTCKSDAFAYYKVVRSSDSNVKWPAGENDKVIGVVESRSKTALADTSFPHGKKVWYRVFCIADKEHDAKVLGRTTAKSIVTPDADPAPEPYLMGFETDVTADGVALHWEKCGSDGFVYYKIVRSTKENPSYLPWTDGSEVIAVIEDGATTSFTDTDVEAGDHYFYRVQSIGVWGGKKVLLGQTTVREVSVD